MQLTIAQNTEKLGGYPDLGVSVTQVPAANNAIHLVFGHGIPLFMYLDTYCRYLTNFLQKEKPAKKGDGYRRKIIHFLDHVPFQGGNIYKTRHLPAFL